MPLPKSVLEKFKRPTLCETGSYAGEAIAMALDVGFNCVHSVELNKDMAAVLQSRYSADKRVHVYCGSSPEVLSRTIMERLDGPITFWLDAHPITSPMYLFQPQFPLMSELLVIRKLLKPGPHVILIDDMRTFSREELGILTFAMKQMWPTADHGFEDTHIATADIYSCSLKV